jgi:hypothetical protein
MFPARKALLCLPKSSNLIESVPHFQTPQEYKFEGFSMESCRSMVAMMDDDKSGKV